ncbi:hypothetical protein [Lewinella sp. W8]|uniref:hypothetical protein n=1 Tax=Lewinella sp. W8 TaxID=2528208 RepID=UPI00110296DE|nr:hypothetical protein [Lewinella sp. W8]MTB53015.1 hypothetical protein [Lewinella sp. W8]
MITKIITYEEDPDKERQAELCDTVPDREDQMVDCVIDLAEVSAAYRCRVKYGGSLINGTSVYLKNGECFSVLAQFPEVLKLLKNDRIGIISRSPKNN